MFTKCISSKLGTGALANDIDFNEILKHMELHNNTVSDFDPEAPTLNALEYSSTQKLENKETVRDLQEAFLDSDVLSTRGV